ncbi:MAG: hypothetical protein ACLFQV_06085 [Vulcanimicrobiota bacterium]
MRNRFSYKKKIFILLVIFLATISFGFCQNPQVNMEYLDSRQDSIRLDNGQSVTIWVTTDNELKKQSVIATTLEISMVTRAYLKHYEIFSDKDSLVKARQGLDFLCQLQNGNGGFYNYVLKNGKIDRNSANSRANLSEHTAHAFFTLGYGINLFKKNGESFRKYQGAFFNTVRGLEKWMDNPGHKFGEYKTFQNQKIPAWFIQGRGDLSSIYLLGLAYYHEVLEDTRVSLVAKKLAFGIMKFKNDAPDFFPNHIYLSHSDYPNIWQTADAFQIASLAYGGKVFKQNGWLEDAQKSALGFLVHLPVSYGPIDGFYPHPDLYPQTPRAAYTLTYNFSALARNLDPRKYEKLTGLSAAWFFKNNSSGHNIYHADDGSCNRGLNIDGLSKEKSLIGSACALLALMEVYNSDAEKMLDYKPELTHSFMVFESEEGQPVEDDFERQSWEYIHGKKGTVVVIRRKNTFWHKFEVTIPDDYFVLMSYQKQPLFSSAVAVNVRVDGGPILLIPLGGAVDGPYMLMQKVSEPVPMLPGPHTIGVRYKGLLFTKPAVIDCLVVQPVLERKIFKDNTGQVLMLVKNWSDERKLLPVKEKVKKTELVVELSKLNGTLVEPVFVEKDKKLFLEIPPRGFGIIKW